MMEQNFQTSFIPKKPMVAERATRARPVNILTIIAIFILFTVFLATGGLYFYKDNLNQKIVTMQKSLNSAKDRFEPAKIKELQILDQRLKAATEILSKHIAVTPIFQALGSVTMKTVRYTKFSYDVGADGALNVQMNGIATGYRSVALQSDLFANNKNFIDPIFSNLTLDSKGNVLFDLKFSVDPNFVNYKQTILIQS